MAIKDYDYAALGVGTTLVNGSGAQAATVGATNISITNGTMTIISDATPGQTACLEGTTQGTSGTSYLTETITSTGSFTVSIFWKMATSVGTIGSSFFYIGGGGSRVAQAGLLSTEQIRFYDAAGGTLFTTTYAGGFVPAQWYRTDIGFTVGSSSTTGRLVGATYLFDSSTALANTSYDSGATINLGTAAIDTIRHGTRATTGTADDNIRLRVRYDRTTATLIGPVASTLATPVVSATKTDPTTVGGTNGKIALTWPAVTGANHYEARVAPGAVPTALTSRTNLFQDPLGVALTKFGGALNYDGTLVTNFPVPAELQDLLGTTTTAVRSTRTATGAARITGPLLGASMPAAGENITVYFLARAGKAMTLSVSARAQVANSSGAVTLATGLSLTTTSQFFSTTGVSFTGTAGSTSGLAFSIPTAAVDATDWVEITVIGFELGTTSVTSGVDERPVIGSRPAISRASFAWSGTANASNSVQTPIAYNTVDPTGPWVTDTAATSGKEFSGLGAGTYIYQVIAKASA